MTDSMKGKEYLYILPIWGEKVAKMGFDLPYSTAAGIGKFWEKSGLIIENPEVDFNNGTTYNMDEIIRFENSVFDANAINTRPDN